MKSRAPIAALIVVAVIYTALAAWCARALRPRADEGFFASPALNLITTGSMGTTVLEGSHPFMKDIHKRTYWITPLHFIAQAAWYEVAGFGLVPMRMLSAVFGLAALAAWFVIARRISGSDSLAAFTVALAGLDYNFIIGGSSGRMDMMAAGLGFSAFAVYLSFRETRFTAALVAANALVCAAGLTHPVAGYLYFAGLAFLALYYDREKFSINRLTLAAVPYVIGFAAWGLYIARDFPAFVAQFTTNSTMKGRLTGLFAPWTGISREIRWRYLTTFGLGVHSYGNRGPIFLKFLILLAFAAGVAGAVATPAIRRNRGYRALMIVAAIFFLLLAVLDGQKAYYYLVHIFPFYAALTAAWVWRVWTTRSMARPLIAVFLGGLFALQLGAVAYRASLNTYATTYAPAIEFLKRNAGTRDLILGSSSLAFGLGFPPNFVDDVRLGYYTGRRPEYIVVNEEYSSVFRDYRRTAPDISRFVSHRLANDYDLVYDYAGFRVYRRRIHPSLAAVR